MDTYKIPFKNMKWEQPNPGVFQKVYSEDNTKIRLIRFESGYKEEEWCTSGHYGFILKGQMALEFSGETVHYEAGEGLWINKGSESKHKVSIESGKSVELIVFETIK